MLIIRAESPEKSQPLLLLLHMKLKVSLHASVRRPLLLLLHMKLKVSLHASVRRRGGLTREFLDFLCGQSDFVNANIINQAQEETACIAVLAGADIQRAT